MTKIDWDSRAWQEDNVVVRQSSPIVDRKRPRILRLRIVSWKTKETSETVKKWKEQLEWFTTTTQYKELGRIDGEPMEFEWKIFPGFTTLQIIREIQNMMDEIQCDPEEFKGRIIFMSMFNDIEW